MATLTTIEKQVINDGQKYLEENNLLKFWQHVKLHYNGIVDCGHIADVFLEAGINPTQGLKTIYSGLFKYSEAEEIEVAEGVEEIAMFAFDDCPNLYKVTLPSTLKTIGKWAFYGCPYLTEIYLPEGITEIGKEAFTDLNLIPYAKEGAYAYEWCKEHYIIVNTY